jgi:hypothetical protein
MAKAGRKRAKGKRTPSGQLSRAGRSDLPNRPSDWVLAQRAKFGSYYSSALGRAYVAGLLGAGNEGKTRLDAGTRFVQRYTRVFGGNAYRCPLDRTPRGNNDNADHERDRHQQDWMYAITDRLDARGLRPWLDQLIHRNYTDTGPYWLDALLNVRWNAHGEKWRVGEAQGKATDLVVLEAALKALDCAAGLAEEDDSKSVDIPLHVCHGRS